MSVKRRMPKMAYGMGQALYEVPYAPIIVNRAPAAGDIAPKGTIWIYGDVVYVLTSIAGGAATWTQCSN